MFQFIQCSGELLHNWMHAGFGYSGSPEGRNKPELQAVHNVGPIPCGTWRIGKPYHHPKLGPCTMDLTPLEGTETFGRSDFRIHGGELHPIEYEAASHGCIIQNRIVRNSIAEEVERGDDLLRVLARGPDDVNPVLPVSVQD